MTTSMTGVSAFASASSLSTSSMSSLSPTGGQLVGGEVSSTMHPTAASASAAGSGVGCGVKRTSIVVVNGENVCDRIPDALKEEREEEEAAEEDFVEALPTTTTEVLTSTPLPDFRHPHSRRRRPPEKRPDGISTLTESLDSSIDDYRSAKLFGDEGDSVAFGDSKSRRRLQDEFVVEIGTKEEEEEEEEALLVGKARGGGGAGKKPRSRPLSPTASMFNIAGNGMREAKVDYRGK